MIFPFAMAEASAKTAPQPTFLEMIFPFALIFLVFYFFIIRPKSKNLRQHQTFLKNMKVGEAVITSSGLLGVVQSISDKYIRLEIAEGVVIKLLREHISGPQVPTQTPSTSSSAGRGSRGMIKGSKEK